jgi:2'-5' RNA ligase/GNAT superfamily N-acetyltransferase
LLPEPVSTEVDALRRAVGPADAVVRIPPHLTLVPPVNVRDADFEDALAVLRRAAAATRPFRLGLGPTATFLPVNPVLYLSVSGDLDALRGLRDRVFVPPLERTLTWPFEPHVTVVEHGPDGGVERAAEVLAGYRADVTFSRVHLLEEHRRDGGMRVWEPIADASFARAAVVGRGGLELELEVGERFGPEVAAWDRAAWEAHGREVFGDAWSPEEAIAVTGRREGEVVGVADGVVRGGEAYLAGLLVRPDLRGEGIGGHLLAAFTAVAVERGCDRVTLRTLAGEPAERFYRARGFTTLAELPEWRFGRPFVQLVRRL